ncbi:hypothetical protein CVT26_006554 [Gymnopilus dilepis]|uniref:Uncharacterized protein n=1 Tax=Gymnopilus dilepis TaxID=231916 RepID=A0A409W5Z6_9AGAR|nr:hypothetical protein CVT26_006554 [Gymnopilus dilepis]
MPGRERFTGLRKAFLEGELEKYKKAFIDGTKTDFLMDVLRRFLKRFPLNLPDDQEPTPEFLAEVDDTSPDQERVAPDATEMPEDQTRYYRLLKEFDDETKLIETRKKQIAQWFATRKDKDETGKPEAKPALKQNKEHDLNDPMTILTLRLLGRPPVRPRKSTDYNTWAKHHKEAVDKAYAVAANGHTGMNLKLRARVAQDLFKQKSKEVQKAFAQMAEEEHKEIIKKWDDALQGPASTAPESRQVCINNIAPFMQSLLDLFAEHTGWRIVLLAGGPEPAAGGRLNIVGLASGGTKGAVNNTFPQAEHDKYHNQVLPAFSDFLRKCYTLEDCRASALISGTHSLLNGLDPSQVSYTSATGENYGPPPTSAPSKESSVRPEQSGQVDREHAKEAATGAPDELRQEDAVRLQREKEQGVVHGSDNDRLNREQTNPHAPPLADGGQRSPSPTFPSNPSHFRYSIAPQSPAMISPARRSLANGEQRSSSPTFPSNPTHFRSSIAPQSPAILSPPRRSLTNVEQRSSSPTFPSNPTHFRSSIPPLSPALPSPARRSPESPSAAPGAGVSSPPFVTSPSHTSGLPSSPCPNRVAAAIAKGVGRTAVQAQRKTFPMRPIPMFPFQLTRPLANASRRVNIPRSPQHAKHRLPKKQSDHSKVREWLEKENVGQKKRKAVSAEEAPIPKRRKTNEVRVASQPAEAAPSSTPAAKTYSLFNPEHLSAAYLKSQLPVDCDSGIRNTLSMLTSACWDRRWQLMTAEWIRFEKIRGFQGSTKFKSTFRPSALADWIKRARSPSYKPQIDIDDFQRDFWQWWANLQPDWRSISDGDAPQQVRGAWDKLDVPGVNGFPTVVAALYFWGLGLGTKWRTSASWSSAVEDVYWVLTQLCGSYIY